MKIAREDKVEKMITENKDTETRCNKAVKQTGKEELEREEERKIKTKDNEN